MPKISHFLQSHSLLGYFVDHPFYGRHMLGRCTCWTYFALAHFHALQCSLGVFSFCIFPSIMNNTHIIGLTPIIHLALTILFLSWFLWGLWYNPTSVQLGHFLVHLFFFSPLSFFLPIRQHKGFGLFVNFSFSFLEC
jgi:hypothetical protein